MYICMCSELNVLISTEQPNKLEIMGPNCVQVYIYIHVRLYVFRAECLN